MIKHLLTLILALATPLLGSSSSSSSSASASASASASSASAQAAAHGEAMDVDMDQKTADADRKSGAARRQADTDHGQPNKRSKLLNGRRDLYPAKPEQVQRAKDLINQRNLGGFIEKYWEWEDRESECLNDSDKIEVLKHLFTTVSTDDVSKDQMQAVARILHRLYQNDQAEVLHEVVPYIPEYWLKHQEFARLTQRAREFAAKQQQPGNSAADLEAQRQGPIFPESWHTMHPYALGLKIAELYKNSMPEDLRRERDEYHKVLEAYYNRPSDVEKDPENDGYEEHDALADGRIMKDPKSGFRAIWKQLCSGLKQIKELSGFERGVIKVVVFKHWFEDWVWAGRYNLYYDAPFYTFTELIEGTFEDEALDDFYAECATEDEATSMGIIAFTGGLGGIAVQRAIFDYLIKKVPTAIYNASDGVLIPSLAALAAEYADRPLGVSVADLRAIFPDKIKVVVYAEHSVYRHRLNLANSMINDCAGLEAFPSVEHLDLSGNWLREIPVALLPGALRTLIVPGHVHFDTREGTVARPTVTRLSMPTLEEKELKHIAQAFPSLREIITYEKRGNFSWSFLSTQFPRLESLVNNRGTRLIADDALYAILEYRRENREAWEAEQRKKEAEQASASSMATD